MPKRIDSNILRILSLGWGVQSFTIAAMVALGELPLIDFAIHADTTFEHQWTYEFAERWTPWLEDRGVRVVTVNGDGELIDKWGGVRIPAFSKGIIKRQCTKYWKVMPIRRYLQGMRDGKKVELLMGITTDEMQRMKFSDVQYIKNNYPLFELSMSRGDCISWLRENNLEVPNRSSCICCPYQTKLEWRELQNQKADWKRADEIDKFIRDKRPPWDLYLCNQRKPLEQCDFRSPQDMGQMELDYA